MNYTIFFLILNLVLISRLRLTMRDDGISGRKDMIWFTIIPLLVLPFLNFNVNWLLLALYLVIHPIVLTSLEKRKEKLNRNRILTLFANILVTGLLASPFSIFSLRNGFRL